MTLATRILASFALLIATPSFAQAGNPTDTTPSGPMHGSLPNKDISDSAAAVRHSATDVTAQNRESSKDATAKYHAMALQRRDDALKLAVKVRNGAVVPPEFGAKLRDAIDGDLQLWREEYKVSGRDYRAAQKRWLAEDKAMTANDWAIRRADWYAERDNWIATHGGVAAN